VRRAAFVVLALCAAACNRGGEGAPPAKEKSVPSSAAPRVLEAARETARTPLTPGERYSASNVLIAFKGAKHAPPSVTRTEDEAKELADKLYADIQAGADLGAVADASSDGPERGHGGRLGIFGADSRMLPEITNTVAGLAIGQIAPPVRSAFGWHIIRRDAVEEIYLAEILVSFAGAEKAPKDMTRSHEKAQALANEALAALAAPGAKFADVAMKYSDHPNKVNGGVIGRVFRGLLPPSLEKVAFALAPGGFSQPIEMPNGVTILTRLNEARVRHILIAYKGANKAPDTVTRTQAEAASLIAEVRDKLARGDSFEKLAESYSDCPSKARGGDLGTIAQGTMTKRFEDAVFALKPGERSGIVETEFGFHIMERTR
jgi:peptidyl-prolyl cis-trans isomerase SurA